MEQGGPIFGSVDKRLLEGEGYPTAKDNFSSYKQAVGRNLNQSIIQHLGLGHAVVLKRR